MVLGNMCVFVNNNSDLFNLDLKIIKALYKAKDSIMEPAKYSMLKTELDTKNAAGQQPIAADFLAEEIFYTILQKSDINGILYSEESGVKILGDPFTENAIVLLLDPLDGSKNYKNGTPIGCISVAYGKHRGNPTLDDLTHAAILNLYDDELYFAVKDLGAWYNNSPIISQPPAAFNGKRHNLNCYTYTPIIKNFFKDFDGQFDTRSLGSVAWELALVARQKSDALIDVRERVKPHDFIAGKIIVEASGGKFSLLSDRSMEQITLGDFTTGYSIIASQDAELQESITDDLKKIIMNKPLTFPKMLPPQLSKF